jgi:hypothetical protein
VFSQVTLSPTLMVMLSGVKRLLETVTFAPLGVEVAMGLTVAVGVDVGVGPSISTR